MDMFIAAWLISALVSWCAISLDMRRLVINRIGLTRAGWLIACAATGPLAGLMYLLLRERGRQALILAACTMLGDTAPIDVRRIRLDALLASGLVGEPVYRACLKRLTQV